MKKNLSVILSALLVSLLFVFAANAQTDNNSNKSGQKTGQQEKDLPLKIKRKPTPVIGKCNQSSGKAMVFVTFDKSAKVTDAEIVVSSGCDSFDKNSVDAARRIQFSPQIKDGEPITVKKRIQYAFERYYE